MLQLPKYIQSTVQTIRRSIHNQTRSNNIATFTTKLDKYFRKKSDYVKDALKNDKFAVQKTFSFLKMIKLYKKLYV